MKNHKILLFDVDDTLLDFQRNEAESFKRMVSDMGMEYREEIYRAYNKLNKELWRQHDAGKLKMESVLNTRFAILFAQFGQEVSGEACEMIYRKYLNQGGQLLPGALELCKELKEKGYRLFIITNGLVQTQISRLHISGLNPLFEEVFISGQIGFQKPTKDFFDYVEAHIKGFEREQALVIGDSLTSDIAGGKGAGIDTCWLCHEEAAFEAGRADYCIRDIRELRQILEIE